MNKQAHRHWEVPTANKRTGGKPASSHHLRGGPGPAGERVVTTVNSGRRGPRDSGPGFKVKCFSNSQEDTIYFLRQEGND